MAASPGLARAADVSVPRSAPARLVLRENRVWMLEAGHVDVFVSRPAEAEGMGRCFHLFRAGGGDALFGLNSDVISLHAVLRDGVTMHTVDRQEFLASLLEPRTGVPRQRMIERWMERLAAAAAGDVRPAPCAVHQAGERLEPSEPLDIQPADGLIWARMRAGASHLCGDPALRIGPHELVPVSASAWLAIEPMADVDLLSTEDLVREQRIDAAIDSAQVVLAAAVHHALDRLASAECAQQQKTIEGTRRELAGALAHIASSFDRRIHALPSSGSGGDAGHAHELLIAACRVIAKALDVSFVPCAAVGRRTAKEGLERLAKRSGFRTRQVMLRDRWWTHDQGPLLGFIRAGKRPVALLPLGASKYELVDPRNPTPCRITDEVAETIAPVAFTFYRTLPATEVGAWELLRTGLHGCGRDLAAILLFGAASGLLATSLPILTRVLVSSLIPGAERSQLGQWMILALACAAVGGALQIARGIAVLRVEMRMSGAIQAAVWARLMSLPLEFFRRYSAGALAVRAMGIDTIRQMMSGPPLRGLLAGVFSIFNVALLFYFNASAAPFAVLLLIVFMATTLFIANGQLRRQRVMTLLRAKTSGVVLQLLTGICKLRVAGGEVRGFGVWARLFSDQRRQQYRSRIMGNAQTVFSAVFPVLANIVLFTVIVQSAQRAPVATGDVIAFIVAFGVCVSAAVSISSAIVSLMLAMPFYEMAKPILQTRPEVSAGESDPGLLSGAISADRLVFQYSADGPPVLQDVSFRVKAGQFVAFVGPSGSGKSTLLRLLLGFETPQSGAIYIDGLDLHGLDVEAVRRQIGVVLQAGRLIPGDVYTNIVGCASATLEQAWDAARMAGLDEDITLMPMGMHTVVTDGGGTLSGGQHQRLMIARAIVSRPRILLLDEATSSLDNGTQAVVSESLGRLRATRIVVAHRLSTIVRADRIFVVDRGRIVQAGTYQELIEQPGLFAELARRQMA